MYPNSKVWLRVTAALQDIEHAQRELGLSECDRGDLEVHRIIARIERKLTKPQPVDPEPYQGFGCNTCGAEPCANLGFCKLCRIADWRLAKQRRSTPAPQQESTT